jgi:hypothetical protein
MNLFINNFSYRPSEQNDNPESLIKEFIQIVEKIRMYSFERLQVPPNYATIEIVQGYSFTTFLQHYHSGTAIHQKLKSLMTNLIKKIDIEDKDEIESIQYIKWNNEESEFLTDAFNTDVPIISFKTHSDFISHQLNVMNEFMDENGKVLSSTGTLNNISDLNHFNLLNEYLTSKQQNFTELQNRWYAKDTPIRFIDRTTQILNDSNFNQNWANANENLRVSLAHSVGRKIAELNGWQYKPILSKRNNRKVFKALNQFVYLSIDTLHGSFEVHDRNGFHCFEINFMGELLEGAQNSHDLVI